MSPASRSIVGWALALCSVLAAPAGLAQSYPARPIRMIIPWPPGGGTDVIGRIICQRLSEQLGQQVVVDNRGGASTIIGTELLAKAAPDGYTYGFQTSNLATNPSLYAKLPYDAAKDFAPVSLAVQGLYVIVVHPSVPVKSVKELIAHVKAAQGKINVALAGPGSPNHLALAQFNTMLGTQLAGIQYKGAAPAVTSLVGGETQLMFISYPTVAPHIQTGRLRLIAVTSEKRSSAAPDVPTAVEAGLPGFVVGEWYGIMAPARTNPAHIARLFEEVQKALAQADVRQKLLALGAEAVASTAAEFGAFVQAETAKWAKIIKAAGIKAE
ncbi:MAG: tripartite tricarboxylate transporter substrate binding protein [Burkholderiales bacterium]|nr:tripartite tricarboxylate transporter substrate binding protein [Burkholderiales bacterium]